MLILFNRYSATLLGDVRFCVPHEARVVLSHDLGPHIYIACEPHSGSHFCLASCPPSHPSWSVFRLYICFISYFLFGYTHLQVYTFYIGYLSISIQLYMHFNYQNIWTSLRSTLPVKRSLG